MRQRYEMTDAQFQRILAACRPRPLMYLSGGMPMGPSVQESANDAWEALGRELGFQFMTVRPSPEGDRVFTAEPEEANRG